MISWIKRAWRGLRGQESGDFNSWVASDYFREVPIQDWPQTLNLIHSDAERASLKGWMLAQTALKLNRLKIDLETAKRQKKARKHIYAELDSVRRVRMAIGGDV